MKSLTTALAPAKTAVTRFLGRTGLKVQKYSPEILMGVGTVAVVGSICLAARGTIKAQKAVQEYKAEKEVIKECHESSMTDASEEDIANGKIYTEEDYQHDTMINVSVLVRDLMVSYGPSVVLAGTGIACFFAAYGIIHKRNVALMAAYSALEECFTRYRDRVRDAYGEEMENRLYYGAEDISTKQITDGNGDMQEVKVMRGNDGYPSPYARFFDKVNAPDEWTPSAEANLMNLRARQNWANDKLKAKGHLFLNEVYDMLGMERSQIGSAVGWLYDKNTGDGFVDFGLYEIDRPFCPTGRFISGNEPSVLLDFNVQGTIWDKI